jgi:hypothetical protein
MCCARGTDDIVMGSPPLAFTFGLGGLLVFPMWAGASVYFPDIPTRREAMAQLMYDVGATICYTAPTFYRQMAPHVKALHRRSAAGAAAAHLRQRRRGAARCDAPALEGGQRHRDAGRHRCHRDVPHLHLGRRPRMCGAARSARSCRAMWPRWSTTQGSEVPIGHGRQAWR